VVSLLISCSADAPSSACRSASSRRRKNATITVTTVYYGASPDLIAGFITTPIESAVEAEASGNDYLTSNSSTAPPP